jgi:NADH-quinone oxidoreductase subunit L
LSGEEEDTDVGFPGPEHHIAERARPMWVAMAVLGFLSIVGGAFQIPGVDHVLETFLTPTFSDSRVFDTVHPSTGADWGGLGIGGLIAILGIGIAYFVWVARRGTSAALVRRLPRLHTFLLHKWYFDELYDAVVYRPVIGAGRFANGVLERVLAQGIVAVAVDAVRGVGVVVRGAQSGFVRAYALLLIGGFAALGLYFLIVSS